MTIAGFQRLGPGSSGRRPLLIALMMYSLGFIGAGLLMWRGGAGLPHAQRLQQLYVAGVAARDMGQLPMGAGDP